MRYFLYARKSTDVEDKQILSIEAQLVELRAIAKRDELEIAEEFIEKWSAKSPGRPVFGDMMARIQNGEAQGIICWKIDRLARTASGNAFPHYAALRVARLSDGGMPLGLILEPRVGIEPTTCALPWRCSTN